MTFSSEAAEWNWNRGREKDSNTHTRGERLGGRGMERERAWLLLELWQETFLLLLPSLQSSQTPLFSADSFPCEMHLPGQYAGVLKSWLSISIYARRVTEDTTHLQWDFCRIHLGINWHFFAFMTWGWRQFCFTCLPSHWPGLAVLDIRSPAFRRDRERPADTGRINMNGNTRVCMCVVSCVCTGKTPAVQNLHWKRVCLRLWSRWGSP